MVRDGYMTKSRFYIMITNKVKATIMKLNSQKGVIYHAYPVCTLSVCSMYAITMKNNLSYVCIYIYIRNYTRYNRTTS